MTPITCNRCNKDMVGPPMNSGMVTERGDPIAGRPILPGFSMRFDVAEEASEEQKVFVQQQLGHYKANFDYRLCMECTLIKMGVVP